MGNFYFSLENNLKGGPLDAFFSFYGCIEFHFFSPEGRSKVAKFAKNYRLDALIVLAKDEQFLFFP